MASVVIRAHFILILSVRHVHGLFVDALEQKDGEHAAQVRKNEEYPDVFSVVNVALEENGPEEAHRWSWVVRWAGHDAAWLAVADDGNVGRSDDQSRDGWVVWHLCVLLSLGQVEEGDEHCTDHLQEHGLDEQIVSFHIVSNGQRLGAICLEKIVAEDGSEQCSSVLSGNVKKTEEAREFSSVASEHEGKRDGRVEVRAGNTRAENKQHEETAEKTNKTATIALECWVEERGEEQSAEELKEQNQERLFECGHAIVRVMCGLHLSCSNIFVKNYL